ncbi:putative elongation of fatty acids protein DDB_G0272012 [Neltuma alba]|uniref:putative elongation of fatty acids protein DDB_G0272012 n=1 Tax=Neltuma alba TaxID=207710 RepID=UPI0010A3FD7F|nr:putative elongation of fatty acids protein DDB_G0272012 [Prosopis alba]
MELSAFLMYYLVSQPAIRNFTWIPNLTPASSFQFPLITVACYLCIIFLLTRVFRLRLPPSILKPITALYDTVILFLSFIMALGCTLSTMSHAPDLHWIICFPPNTPPSGPVFFWAYVFYLSKILEFFDTLLILLSDSIHRFTLLHVSHHAIVIPMCYVWLWTSQSLFPVVLVTNASVHVLMYAYYLLCALGVHPKWKRFVTSCQIAQFRASFGALALMLGYHVFGPGCSGVWGWILNLLFYAWLLFHFLSFREQAYKSKSE